MTMPFLSFAEMSLSAREKGTKSDHTRLAPSCVTLSEAKGLKARFFASLRMTMVGGYIVKCTNVLWSDLVLASERRISLFSLEKDWRTNVRRTWASTVKVN